MTSRTLADIAKQIGATLHGEGDVVITGIAPLGKAQSGQIAFLANAKYKSQLKDTQASAVILSPDWADACNTQTLVMDNPYHGFALLAKLFDKTPLPMEGCHATAVVASSARFGEEVRIGAHCVIGDRVVIGAGSILHAGVKIYPGVIIGDDCVVHANTVVYHDCDIGDRCVIQANATIGSDGFGMAKDDAGRWVKIPQLGRVVIGDDVEIGANTTIDRGALEDTVIASQVKLDNQIQIGHNVTIGEGTAIAACTGIAGSTSIGKHCLIGGAVGIAGHLTLVDQVMLTAQSGVTKSINTPGIYSSTMPVLPVAQWLKLCACFRRLDKKN